MSQIAESIRKQEPQLPLIKPKEESNTANQANESDEENLFPLTHGNKPKKHRKKFRKHSPEYYEQKKLRKLNKKLEKKWDSHFVNDHIPDLYLKKKNLQNEGKTLSKLSHDKRSITALENKTPGNTIAYLNSRKDSLPAKAQKNSKRFKSFNVHLLSQAGNDFSIKALKKLDLAQKQPKEKQIYANDSEKLSSLQRPNDEQKVNAKIQQIIQQKLQKKIQQKLDQKLQQKLQQKLDERIDQNISHKISQKIQQKIQERAQKKIHSKLQKKQSSNAITNGKSQKRKRTSDKFKRPGSQEQRASLLLTYKNNIQEIFEKYKFLHCHKEVLEKFFDGLQKKSVRDVLDKQFNLLKTKQSLIYKVMSAIANRQNYLEKIINLSQKLLFNGKGTLELLDNYRTSTLVIVEEILKWKQTWQTIYSQLFKKSNTFDLVFKAQNYLLTLMKSTDQFLIKVSQFKDKKKQENKSTDSFNLKKQENNSQDNQKILNQKSSSKNQKEQKISVSHEIQKKQTNLSKKIVTQTTQKLKSPRQNGVSMEQFTKTQKQTQKMVEKVDVISSLTKPIKLENLVKEVEKPTILSKKEEPKIIKNDPFLISFHSIQRQDKNIILKIRACQLLLLQEQYNSIKK